jgi:hypothetical protein
MYEQTTRLREIRWREIERINGTEGRWDTRKEGKKIMRAIAVTLQ